jgi:hypothetical protein
MNYAMTFYTGFAIYKPRICSRHETFLLEELLYLPKARHPFEARTIGLGANSRGKRFKENAVPL